jgi:predicted dehydrogenase
MPIVSPLRIAVIGTGNFAEVCHIPGIESHPAAEVVAVYGRRLEAARTLADRFQISKATDDFAAICQDPEIDAVTIASADIAHASQAIMALKAGKHVFCEKPLAVNAAEAREMAAVAEASGKVHQVAFTFRYNDGLNEMRRRIAAGEIGTPFFARIQYDRWNGLSDDWFTSWRTKKHYAGAGILFEVGSHLFDIASHVLGPIDSVIGYTHLVPREAPDEISGEMANVETDDLVNAWVRHQNGVRSQIFTSRVTPPFAELGYLEVVGDKGSLKASLSRGGVDRLKSSRPDAVEWRDVPLPAEASDGQPHALPRMMHSFVDACLRGSLDPEVDASFREGLKSQLAMSALLESQSEERWIRLVEVK